MMAQTRASDQGFFAAPGPGNRKSQGRPFVRQSMRYVLLLILIGLLVFLSNQLWLLFVGSPLF
jgi:hypothetical protein